MSNIVSVFIRNAWKSLTKHASMDENESQNDDDDIEKKASSSEKISSTAGAMSGMRIDVNLVKNARIADSKMREIIHAVKIIHERLLEAEQNETPPEDFYLRQDLNQLSVLEKKLNTMEYVDKDRIANTKEHIDVIKNKIENLLNLSAKNDDQSGGGGGGGLQNIKPITKPPSRGQI